MRIKLRLTQKGLLFVAVPIAFELVLLITLAGLLGQAERAAAAAAHVKAIAAQTNTLITMLYDTAGIIVVYPRAPNDDRIYQSLLNNIPREVIKLKKTIGDDPRQQAMLNRLLPDLDHVLNFIAEYKNELDRGDSRSAFARITQWSAEFEGAFRRSIDRLHELARYQNEHLIADPAAEANARAEMKLYVEV
ncbi:MAG TPA: hypothetical protein V6C72_05865, partial [Chroococcales cyanobacterium]